MDVRIFDVSHGFCALVVADNFRAFRYLSRT